MNLLVVGSAIVDVIARPTSIVHHDTSNEAEITWAAGGAGRNVAENLARLGASVTFVTDAADDAPGRFLMGELERLGIEVRRSRRDRTGLYLAVLQPDGTLDLGFCQTGTQHVSWADIEAVLSDLHTFDGAVFDANLSAGVIETLAERCRRARVPYALDPSAHERCARIAGAIPGCDLVKPDRSEATALTGLGCDTAAAAAGCAQALLARGARRAIVSLGADGLVFADADRHTVLPALPATVTDVTGAGDAMLAAAFLGLLQGLPNERALDAGRRAAALTCAVRGAVSPAMTPSLLRE